MPDTPLLDRMELERSMGYEPPVSPNNLPNVPYKHLETPYTPEGGDGGKYISPLEALENAALSIKGSGKILGGSIPRTIGESISPRYNMFVPGDYDNEDAYAQGQGWTSKMVNGVGKGLMLTGTTLLQSTAGLIVGLVKWAEDGRAASFYDNEMNRNLDEINKKMEDILPNYYTNVEKNAAWYSTDKLFTANFFWDGIIKNMGFAAGAAISGGIYSSVLKALPLTARLFSVGKAAEALAATEEGLLGANKVAETFGKVKSLSDQFVSSYKTLNAGGRALVAGLSTTGEAGFEAYSNMHQFRDGRISEWKALHNGEEPKGADLELINAEAENVGNSSFLLNTALLSATNYIQFPKILGSSYKAEKSVINGLTKEIGETVTDATGKIIAKAPITKFGKILSTLNKVRPYTFSTSEAFEEGAQYAIQVGTQDYYNKQYKGDSTDFIWSAVEGIKQTVGTDEGMSNVLIGGLSGSLMMAKGRFQEQREKSKNTAEAIAKFNKFKLSDFTKETTDSINRGTVLQQEREQTLKDGDILESKDKETDYIINYLSPRIKYGRMDLVTTDLNDLRSLASSDEGFAQLVSEGKALQGDTKEAYLQRLNGLESTANNIKSLYESLNIRYGGMIDKYGKPTYSSDVMNKMVYAGTKIADYDERIPKVASALALTGVDTASIIEDVANGNFESYDKAMSFIEGMGKKLTGDQITDFKQSLQDVAELTLRRQKFLKEYNDIKENPDKHTEVVPEETKDENAPKEFVKIKTKKGEFTFEIGKELFIGKTVKKSDTGEDVFGSSRFTILADNGDGTLKIKDANGIRNIKKSDIEPYNIGYMESIEKNKKAKFFLENWNTVYEHKGIKINGKPAKGRLEYSPKDETLLFKFINERGKERTIEVRNSQFVAAKGYNSAMIEAVSKLTASQQSSLESYTKEKEDIRESIQKRKQVVVDLVNNSKDRLDKVNDELDKAQESLKQVDEALKNATFTKKGLPRKNLKSFKKTIDQLSKQKESIEKVIDSLQEEKEELETQLPYMQSLLEYAETMPEDYKEAIEDLKDDIDSIEEMIDNTNDAIKTGGSLLSKIDTLLKDALSITDDFVKRLKEENPNVLLFIDDFRNSIERFLGEEGAKDFIAQKLGYTQAILDLQDQIGEFTEEMNIPNLSKKIENLQKDLTELESGLEDLVNQSVAKGKLLEAFETNVAKFEQELAEEQRLQQDDAFVSMIMKTGDNSQRTIESEETYEEDSKKTNTNIPRSTIASQNIPGYERSNAFGNNLPNLPEKERKSIKAVLVTRENQADVLPGLIEHLGQGNLSEADMNNTIAVVMVKEEADGSRKLVGVDGKVLENPTVENTIYQVMPTEELKWSEEYGGGDMFRKGTLDEVKEDLRAQYKKWREETLTTPPTRTFSIEASFGVPQRVPQKDENGLVITDKKGNPLEDESAVVSVSEAGLVKEDTLENNRVLTIPTTNGIISKGTTMFKNAIGRVFLTLNNAYVKLQNRQLTEKEATTVYQATLRLSEIMFEEGEVKSEEAQRLLRWLKSVVYWGTPKDAQGKEKEKGGYNSVFFKSMAVEGSTFKQLRLFISNKGGNIPFTASYLRDNKSQMIALFQELYNNVNSTRANGGKKNEWNEPYEEILEVKSNGDVVTREWQNYQTYLLSSKNPDGSNRKKEEIPLFTNIKPKISDEEVNRQGVYFVLEDLKYKEPTPKAAPKTTPTKIIPGAKTAPTAPIKKGAAVKAKEGEIDLNGKINTFTSSNGNKIRWAYIPTKSGLDVISVQPGGDLVTALDSVKEQVKKDAEKEGITLTEEQIDKKAKDTIKSFIKNSIPAGALEEKEDFSGIIIGEDDEENYEDADTYVEPDPTEKAEEELGGIIIGEEEDDIEQQMRDDDEDDPMLRKVIDEEIDNYETENWTKIEKWLKDNFSNLPVYRVKNILRGTNGLQAWGMLKNGALYVYENAEVGTLYHEVFEGVWKMMSSPKERKAVIKEFTSRKGSFVDRPTGQVIAYKDATNSQVKEQLAEEFRDYVQYKKIPVKPVDGRPFIVKLFADIVNAIKNFFVNTTDAKNNTERLFAKIGTGYYKDFIPFETNLSFAKKGIIDIEDATISGDSELRLKIPGETVHDLMQQMTYITLRDIMATNDSLFNVENKPKSELYKMLKYNIGKTILKKARATRKLRDGGKYTKEQAAPIIEKGIALWKTTMRNWEDIVNKHQEYLRSYNIEFDENDELNVKADENTGRGEYDSSDKIDHFRKTNSAIKLLLSTLPIMEDGNPQYSSINGVKLLPLSQVYMSLMNNLHTSRSLDDMIERIRQMAIEDENYRFLYSRLTDTDYSENTVDFSEMMDVHDLQLLTAMWITFKKQSPDARTVFIFDSGEVNMGESNLSTAARQIKSEYETAIISTVRKKNPYFEYSDKEKKFLGKPSGIKNVKLGSTAAKVAFLKTLGIDFTENEIDKLPTDKKTTFDDAVAGIRESISKADEIATVSGKVLDIEGRLLQLGLVRASISNPEFDSTFFNVKGERTQSFVGTNAISDFFDAISQIENLNDLQGTQYEYLLTDEFVEGSVIISKMFNMKTGERKDSPLFMKAGYADGTVNLANGKRKQSSKLTYKDRLIQEINMNLNGYYSNLVPGDASMEHTVFMGNAISEQSLLSGFNNIFKIFGGYLQSEIKLSRNPDRIIVQDENETRNKKDLRFFKGILGEELHNKIIKDTKTPIEEIYGSNENPGKYKKQVDQAVESFIKKEAEKTRAELREYGIIKTDIEGDLVVENIAFNKADGITEPDLNRQLNALAANYIINNIELHKLIYSDPYQYTDELKRIKNFLSPRQAILYGSKKMNEAMNNVYNRGYEKGDIGRTDFNRDYFKTISYNDVLGEHDLPGYQEAMYKETDGAGIINFKSYRNFRIRRGKWSAAEEAQYKYDIAWEKNDRGLKLSDYEKEILKDGNPEIRSAYTTEKPIVAGNKADGNSFNDVVLDKYALYPLSYRIVKQLNPTSNALKLYEKMQKEDIDYIVFDSVRKVGAKNSVPLYVDGVLNPAPYNNNSITNIPFAIMSVQAEVPSKEDEIVTRGSQVTKLATLDFMEAGVPIDFEEGKTFEERYAKWITLSEKEKENSELYKEIKNNQMLLEEMTDNGYQSLLKKMGITETKEANGEFSYKVENFNDAAKTLREEILKRETNDNVIDSLDDFLNGGAVLEATPAYQQIRNILYSIADKNVISPKITGGMKVQIPSTLLESVRAESKVIETKKGPKTVYTSKELSFYKDEDGKRVCEIMVGRWFKSDMTDEKLMEYFKSDEGKKILSGIGFRIPSQKQNSIDAFVIKRFLPAEFGDNVIVPAALVLKHGSDFDIDKLSLYFKNIFKDGKGNIKLVPYLGTGKEALAKFEDMFFDILQERIDQKEAKKLSTSNLQTLFGELSLGETTEKTKRKWVPIFKEMFKEDLVDNKLPVEKIENFFIEKLEKIGKDLENLTDYDVQQIIAEEFRDKMYKQSLENAYVESLEKLVTHPKNFEQLVKPNSPEQLKNLSAEITKLRGFEGFDYSSTKNMLSRTFMSRLRHAFVTGKYAIGIAAVNQTNHSLNQRQPIYIDRDKLDNVSEEDKAWLGDGKIKFDKYNSMTIKGKTVPVLSMIKNKAGEFISDLIGQFIDGYVDISKGPWIMELGASPNVAGTFLFLIKIGVPMNTVGYFMNQPIIRDYLNKVENAGYSWLFIDTFVKETLEEYKSDITASDKIPSETALEKMVGQKGKLSKQQLAQQQVILKEFLKYAKMANHMFLVTQGSNFDTANFNDSFLIFKKGEQLKKAQNTIFSSIDKDGKSVPAVNSILENSFVGKLGYILSRIRNAYSQFLHSDRGNVRNVLENVLLPYVNMPDREFVKLAQKAVVDLFDWAVQTDPSKKLNMAIADILIKDGGTAEELATLFETLKKDKAMKNNYIVQNLVHEITGEVNNMKLKNRDNKVYDQNQVIYGFAELKNYLNGKNQLPLYKRLVAMSILQSGLSNSPISFTQLLPYEDFKEEYNKILSKLDNISNLEDFHNLGVFQRNNWSNDDITPYSRARWIQVPDYTFGKRWVYNPAMEFLPKSIKEGVLNGRISQVVTLSTLSSEAQSEYIVYSWEKGPEDLLTEKELSLSSTKQYKLLKEKKIAMKKKGDLSYMQKGLFQKVKESDELNSDNLIHTYTNKAGEVREYYVYKMINAWGDSFRANEFYTVGKPSVIDNRFLKTKETSDGPIINAFLQEKTKKPKTRTGSTVTKTVSTQSSTSVKGININTKSSDKLGRELTNPNWGAKNIMDIEAEYKANASKIKAPQLTMDEALKYDMNLMYKLQMNKFKIHPELVKEITDRGGVKFLEASEHTVGVKGSRWEGKGTNSNFIKVLIKSYQDSLNTTQSSTSVETADKASLKSQIAELESRMKTKGLGPADMAVLKNLQTQLGKIIKSEC
jgi:hypothetical protein